jgi:outer membrane protein
MLQSVDRVVACLNPRLKAAVVIKMHEANQYVIYELLETVRQRQRGGLATGLDIARLEAHLAPARQQGSSARYDLEHVKLSFLCLLALPTETPLALTDEWLTDVGCSDAARGGRSGLEPTAIGSGTAHPCESFRTDRFSITGERLQSLVAQGEYRLIGNRWNKRLGTYNMALILQIPIFQGPQREGRIAQARASGSKNRYA